MAPTTVRAFDITIPAGTTAAAPLVTLTQFDPDIVERIEWLFPDGCCGLVGIQIGARAVPIIPRLVSQWLIRSGDSAGFDLAEMHVTGDWSVIGYNTGANPHTIHVQFVTHRLVKRKPLEVLVIDGVRLIGQGAS